MKRIANVLRDGIDMQTAFVSHVRRATIEHPEGVRPSAGSDVLVGTRARSPIRLVARSLYRVARPVFRPIVLRVRSLLVGPIEDELRQQRRRIDEIWQFSQAAGRRVAVACGPDKVLVRTEAGYALCSTHDLGTLAVLIERGDLERGTRRLIERLIEPGDVFVDVGANLGLHTLAAGRAMQGRGRVYAIEPFGPTVELLRESVLINGLSAIVEIHQAAASDHRGQQPLFLGPVSGHHSLLPLSPPQGSEPSSVDVPVVTLDDVLADAAPVNLMKIDVEGTELEVLDGARSVIGRNEEIALIVEYGPSHLERAGRSAQDWFSRFDDLGLSFREIDAETGRLYERSIDSLADVESTNLLFARPTALVWRRAAR